MPDNGWKTGGDDAPSLLLWSRKPLSSLHWTIGKLLSEVGDGWTVAGLNLMEAALVRMRAPRKRRGL